MLGSVWFVCEQKTRLAATAATFVAHASRHVSDSRA